MNQAGGCTRGVLCPCCSARQLVNTMGLGTVIPGRIPDLGAACDGDADRNMILGKLRPAMPTCRRRTCHGPAELSWPCWCLSRSRAPLSALQCELPGSRRTKA